jgi:hypothetical protein
MEILDGTKFGKLTTVGPTYKREGSYRFYVKCICDCGKELEVRVENLKSGNTSSCGCGRIVDLTGKRFGQLKVLKFDHVDDLGSWWLCKCACGKDKVIRASSLKCGDAKTCGHRDDYTGMRFGRLLVLGKDLSPRTAKRKRVKWMCLCDCGNMTSVESNNLLSGNTVSCGCHRKTWAISHGLTGTPIYGVWDNMMQRCYNVNDGGYRDYGGRGIIVCERWHTFTNFAEDMGPRPEGLEIDRIDNGRGYSPENCRWVTRKENCRNTRGNRFLTFNGETKCVAQWTEELGYNKGTIRGRLNRNWSVERALTEPLAEKYRPKKKKK